MEHEKQDWFSEGWAEDGGLVADGREDETLPPEETEEGLHVHWDVSYDMNGEAITYTCILANDPGFTDVIAQADDIRIPEYTFDVDLEPGQYYIRVQATNESGHTMECFDYYNRDETLDGKRYGCYAFTKNADGTFDPIISAE